MKQYALKLDKTRQRPVVILKNGLTALFDTGAYIPVWMDDEDILVSDLNAVLVKKICHYLVLVVPQLAICMK